MVWYTTPIQGHFDINIYIHPRAEMHLWQELLTHRGDIDNIFSQMSESPGYAHGGPGNSHWLVHYLVVQNLTVLTTLLVCHNIRNFPYHESPVFFNFDWDRLTTPLEPMEMPLSLLGRFYQSVMEVFEIILMYCLIIIQLLSEIYVDLLMFSEWRGRVDSREHQSTSMQQICAQIWQSQPTWWVRLFYKLIYSNKKVVVFVNSHFHALIL